MTPLTLDDVLADIRQLPSLPALVGELVLALQNEASDISQLADGIARDQALAARTLRVANSPFYGNPNKVASIHDAIVILGYRAVGNLVMAASLTGLFLPAPQTGFNLGRFWRHGIATALAARALARGSGLDAEAAFSAGLLHDIGVLVLLTTRPHEYTRVLAQRAARDCELAVVERELLGFDHAQVGAALADRWLFPAEIARAVALHHSPSAVDGGSNALIDVVHVADVLAHALDLADAPDEWVPVLDALSWGRLGLNAGRVKSLLPGIEVEHGGYCALLGD